MFGPTLFGPTPEAAFGRLPTKYQPSSSSWGNDRMRSRALPSTPLEPKAPLLILSRCPSPPRWEGPKASRLAVPASTATQGSPTPRQGGAPDESTAGAPVAHPPTVAHNPGGPPTVAHNLRSQSAKSICEVNPVGPLRMGGAENRSSSSSHQTLRPPMKGLRMPGCYPRR